MSNFCSFWTGLFHRKRGLQNSTGQSDLNAEDANVTFPQDQTDARFSGITGSPSLVRIPVSKSRHGALQLCLSAKSVSNVSCYEVRRALDTGSKSSGKQKSYFNMGLGGTSSDVVREVEAIFQLAVPLTVEANEGMNLSFETENVALSTLNSDFPQHHNAVSLERCSLDDPHLHLPVLEGFIMQIDDAEPSISFDKLDQLKSVIERNSILEEHCKSACMQNFVSSVPTGLLEGMDGKNKPPISDAVKQINDNYGCLSEERKQMHLDHRAVDRVEFIQKVKEKEKKLMYKRYEIEREAARMMEEEKALEQLKRTLVPQARPVPKFDKLPIRLSPVSRVWESLNTKLPCIAEENENAEEIAKGNVPEVWTSSFKRIPKKKLENPKSSKRNNKEKQTLAVGTSGVKWAESIYNRSNKPKLTGKTSLRGGPSLSETEPKHNNTVSGITSFIPLVQQKQAAAALPVTRDIKVKALKAAKEENEPKTEKKALKIERARQEKENLRQLELQKKKKEEEHKKKEADMTARKKQREEKENKAKERKQMCLEEERKQHREYEQKFGAEKPEKDGKLRTMNERGHKMNDSKNERGKHKMDKEKGHSLCKIFRRCNYTHSTVNK